MILQPTTRRPAAWPLRVALLTIGLAVLLLSIRTLWADPASPVAEVTTEAQFVAGPAVDERIDVPEQSVNVEDSLNEFRHRATMNIELSATNYNRRLAAERQFEAVKEAYENETVTLDQLLDAQRRLAEARVSYARAVCDLETDPAKREYIFALASLTASNQALKDAKRIWKKAHESSIAESKGIEAREEAQAREQYFQFKQTSQMALEKYLAAKAAWEGRRPAGR